MKIYFKKSFLVTLLLSVCMVLSACSGIGVELEVSNPIKKDGQTVVKNTYTPKQLPCQLGLPEDADEDEVFNYTEVARNYNSILYADMRNGHFALQDINTEKIWYSIPNNLELDEITRGANRSEVRSEVLVNYVLKEEESVSKSYKTEGSFTCKEENIKTELIENGFRITYTFRKSDIIVPIEYRLTNSGFEAEVMAKDIKESDTAYLISVNLLPSFGAGAWDEEGYVFIPDGSGAIVDFSYHNDMESGYVKDVYGEEKAVNSQFSLPNETIKLPVFGTMVGSNSLMGIITKGDAAAAISTIYHSDSYGYTAVSSLFNYRTIDVKKMFENYSSTIQRITYRVSDIHAFSDGYIVEYHILNGNDCGYVGMAKEYRSYLSKNKLINKTENKPVFNLQVYGAVDINTSFLGIDYNTTEVLTTAKQAEKIVDSLKKGGVTDIALRYVGFSGDGVLNKKLNTSTKPISKVSNVTDFKNLASKVKLYPDYDLMSVRKAGNGVSFKEDVIRTTFDYKAEQFIYSRSIYSKLSEDAIYLLNGKAVLGATDKLLKNYSSKENISLSSLGQLLYSDFAEKDGAYKDKTVAYIKEALNRFSKKCDNVALENANAYTFKYADKIWGVSGYSSGFDVFKVDVPFYEIVLHGNITMTSPCIIQSQNPKIQVLKAVEAGNELLFAATYADSDALLGSRYESLYSTGYKNWMDYATDIYNKYRPILSKIYNKEIVDHYEFTDGVFVTEYENGVKIAVNYNSKAVEIDSVKIGGLDYEVIKEGGTINE